MQVFHVLFPILLLLGVPVLSVPLHVHHLGGSLQQVGQTVAAGMATNLQWFQPVGTGNLHCNCQTLGLVLRLRVYFVLPLSQEQKEEQDPLTKIYQWGYTRRLKFDA